VPGPETPAEYAVRVPTEKPVKVKLLNNVPFLGSFEGERELK
jgi:hypothetical protein